MGDIYAMVPINKMAAVVTGAGEHFTPCKLVLTNDSDTPIATRRFTRAEVRADGFLDLTGRRVGRFTVLGISRNFSRQWVVRCDCGRYSTRTAKAVKNPENTQDRCEHCRHLAFLRRDEYKRNTGRDKDIRAF